MTNDLSRPTGEDLATAYRESRLRTTALLNGLSPEDEQRIVPSCPEWRVRDLLSHVNALADDLSAGRGPTGDTQAWVDKQVTDRIDVTVADQLEQWSTSGASFEEMLRTTPQLKGLVFDLVTHEHDFAGALGTRSDRASSAIDLVMSAKAGTVNRDLTAAGLQAIRIVAGDKVWHYGEGEVELEVRGDAWEMFRLTGGRRSMAQLQASDHDGDIVRYAPGLVHNPLASSDIVE